MSIDLSTLLHDATDAPPPEDWDVLEVVSLGRRRVRRRRLVAIAGVVAFAATVAAVAGAAPIVWSRHDAAGPATDTTQLTTSPSPEAIGTPTVRALADSAAAVEGRDFTTVGSVTSSGAFLAGVLSDGDLLFTDARSTWTRAAGDQRQTLKGVGSDWGYLGETQGKLIFTDGDNQDQVYDEATGTLSPAADPTDPRATSVTDQVDQVAVSVVTADGTLWTARLDPASPTGGPYRYDLYSLALGKAWTPSAVAVGAYTALGSTLAWTATDQGPSSTITVLNAADGTRREFSGAAPSSCRSRSIALTDDRVLVGSACAGLSKHDERSANRIDVYTRDGQLVTTYTSPDGVWLQRAQSGPLTVSTEKVSYVFEHDTMLRLPADKGLTANANGPMVGWEVSPEHFVVATFK